ncbi:MAG: hypothetical protein HY744_19480 [Deltaproteobacteria bacterium]|nr:hypothetical protein [Deltaproteobacteria bacterium]
MPVIPRRPAALLLGAAALLGAAGPASCGRSELRLPRLPPPQPECNRHEDCPGYDDRCRPVRCVDPDTYEGELPELAPGQVLPPRVCVPLAPKSCDDSDPCTEDACDPRTGECSHTLATLDLDGDGHRAPLPGTLPGEPDSCGDDCDDANAAAYPGAVEICDGVDNDCNGVVDDNASFVPLGDSPLKISGPIAPAEPGGLAFSGESYLSIYTGTTEGFDVYETRLDSHGEKLPPIEQKVALQNADSIGGPLVWIGDRYGFAWQDRRDGNYEIYFTLLDAEGEKSLPDTRLSYADGFSVNLSMTWNGHDFVVVWQDDRDGMFEIYAQRVSWEGAPIGGNVQLSDPGGFDDESPEAAAGTGSIGVAYANGSSDLQVIRFRTYAYDTLDPLSEVVDLTDGSTQAVYPTTVWNHDRYVVAWFDRTASPKAVYGAVISEQGELLAPPTPLTQPGASRSRYPALMPLGDRLLIVYSDDRDANQGYELYARMVAADLSPLGPEHRLTNAPFDSIYPVPAFGPEGNVGILFRDDRDGGEHHVWFTRLGCVAGEGGEG